MAAVRVLPPALADLQRLVGFLQAEDPRGAGDTARLIFEALRVLEKYPLIGRSLHGDRRELVIYRGKTGYLAQYQYDVEHDEVLIVAMRHQRGIER
jgi:plasmid stabilization system protein ParE